MTSVLASIDHPPCTLCGQSRGLIADVSLFNSKQRLASAINELASSRWYTTVRQLLDDGELCSDCSSALTSQSLKYSEALYFATLAHQLDDENTAAQRLIDTFGGWQPATNEPLRDYARKTLDLGTRSTIEPHGTFEELRKEVLLQGLPAPATRKQLEAEVDHWSNVRAGLSDMEKASVVASGLVDPAVCNWMMEDIHAEDALASLATHADFRTARSAIQRIHNLDLIIQLLRRDDVRHDLHTIFIDRFADNGEIDVLRGLSTDQRIGENDKLHQYIETRIFWIGHSSS